MTRSRSFSRSSARFGSVVSSNAPDEHADDVGALAEAPRANGRPMSPGRRGERENPVRLVVHQRERAVAVNRDDAVAHAADEVPEEPVVGVGAAAARRARQRASASRAPARAGRRGVSGMGDTVRQLDCEGQSDVPAAERRQWPKNRLKSTTYGIERERRV